MFVTSYSVTYCIYIPGKPGFCFHYCCAVFYECKHSDTFWLADRVHLICTLYHLIIIIVQYLSENIEPKKCLSDILSSVWVWLGIFPQLSIIQYMGLCVFSLPITLVMIERIYTLSYYLHQIGSMNYYPLFRVRSWNNGMRCMYLYIRINKTKQFLSTSPSVTINMLKIIYSLSSPRKQTYWSTYDASKSDILLTIRWMQIIFRNVHSC